MRVSGTRNFSRPPTVISIAAAAVLSVAAVSAAFTPSRPPGMGFAGVSEPAGPSSAGLNPASLAFTQENEASAGFSNGVSGGTAMDASYTRIFRAFSPVSVLASKNLASSDFGFSAAFGRAERLNFLPDFVWGARAGVASADDSGAKPDVTLGAQFPVESWRFGAALTAGGSDASARIGGSTYIIDEYLAAFDLDTESKVYIGLETGVYGGLGRLRVGVNMRDESFTAGLGSYMWPYAMDVYFSLPFNAVRDGRLGFSFVYRFGGYNFSQVLLERNTEKIMYLEKRIKDSKSDLSALNKKLVETEDAYRKARDFVDILDSEASELIKQKLKMMKGSSAEPPSAPAVPRAATQPAAPKKTWPVRHRATAGDSLRSLSQKYYGDANKWQKIYDANRNKIERGLPKLGEEIIIPAP